MLSQWLVICIGKTCKAYANDLIICYRMSSLQWKEKAETQLWLKTFFIGDVSIAYKRIRQGDYYLLQQKKLQV